MKIVDAEVYLVQLPTRRAHNWVGKMSAPIGHHAIVRLHTDEGICGWGEAAAVMTWGGSRMRYYGESSQTVAHVVAEVLLPAIKGQDPAAIDVIHALMDDAVRGHPYAKAAVDTACYDATGRALGIPVHALLGGKHRDRLEIAHSLGVMPLGDAVDEAGEAVAEGARTLKCKTGLNPAADVELVGRVRERVGPETRIRVDCNGGYLDAKDAQAVIRSQERHGILLCEEPVHGLEAQAYVASGVSTPIMADESVWTAHDVVAMSQYPGMSFFSCYFAKPGGLYRARQQLSVAEMYGIRCDIGGSIESGVGNAANLHLGAAARLATLPSVCPVSLPQGAEGPSVAGIYYSDDVITGPFRFEDGCVLVPEGPGLGIDVDVDKLERYAAPRDSSGRPPPDPVG